MSSQSNFLWGLEISDALTMELTAKMTVIALGVGVICFICNMAYNYLYHGASQLLTPDENKFPDLMEIARCMALMFCLTLYVPIAKTIVGTLEVINQSTTMSSSRAGEFERYMKEYSEQQADLILDYQKKALESGIADDEDEEGAMQKEIYNIEEDNSTSWIGKLLRILNPLNFVTALFHAFAALLMGVVQVIVLGIAVVIIKILVILGPFAFAVSILPVFQKQLSVWFGSLCTIGFVFSVINVLGQIVSTSMIMIYNSSNFDLMDEATKIIQYPAMDLAIIGSYLSCFWIASRIVGHADAGRIISKTVATITGACSIVIAGAAASSIISNSTNVGAASSLGGSIINNEE